MTQEITDEDFYKQFSQLYTELTASGKAPWMKEGKIERGISYNPSSGVIFKGVNSLMLEMSAAQNGFSDSRWLSMDEMEKLGYKPRYKQQPTPIAYVNKFSHPTDVHPSTGMKFDRDNQKQKYYYMYNVEQLHDCDLRRGKGFIISKEIVDEKIKNTVKNAGTKNFQEITVKLEQEAVKTAPRNTEELAAAVVQYRLSQEFSTPYRPSVPPENLKICCAVFIRQKSPRTDLYQKTENWITG